MWNGQTYEVSVWMGTYPICLPPKQHKNKHQTQFWKQIVVKNVQTQWIYLTLLLGALEDAFLYGPLTDESVDRHLLGLSQAMGAVHGLLVHRGVPVTVVEDHLKHTVNVLQIVIVFMLM